MLNLLKTIGNAFLLSMISVQLESMQYQDIKSINYKTYLDNVTLSDLAVDKICEQIYLKCKSEAKNPSEINKDINEEIFNYLPLELIQRIKARFIKKYGHAKSSFIKKCKFFDQKISQLKTSGKNIAILLKNFNLYIYNYETENKKNYDNVKTFEFLPNGDLATATENGVFIIDKNIHDIKLQISCELKRIKNMIAISDDKIVIALADKLLICELNNCKIYELRSTKNAHENEIISVTQLSNEKICTNSWDNTLKIWNLNTGELLGTLQLNAKSILKKPIVLQDNIICYGHLETSLQICNIQSLKTINTINASDFFLREILITPNNNVITASNNSIKVWDVNFEGGKCIRSEIFKNPKNTETLNSVILLNEKLIAFCSINCTLQILNIENGSYLSSHETEKPLENLIKLENNWIVSYDADGTLYFYTLGFNFEDKTAELVQKNSNNKFKYNAEQSNIKISKPKKIEKTNRKLFKCDIENCNLLFQTAKGLSMHKKAHSRLSYQCNLCKANYFSRVNLKRHLRTHLQKCGSSPQDESFQCRRPFICSLCGKIFKSKPILMCHKRVHHDEIFMNLDKEQNAKTKPYDINQLPLTKIKPSEANDVDNEDIKDSNVKSLKIQAIDFICTKLEQTYGLSKCSLNEIEFTIDQLYSKAIPEELLIQIKDHFFYKYIKNRNSDCA